MRLTVLGKSPSWQDADGACSGYLIEEDGDHRAARLRQRRVLEAAPLPRLHEGRRGRDLASARGPLPRPGAVLLRAHLRAAPAAHAGRPLARAPQTPARPKLHAPHGATELFRRVVGAWGNEDLIENAFEIEEFEPDSVLEIGSMRFRFQHVPHFTETFAIDIASMNGGGRITYGADCSPNEAAGRVRARHGPADRRGDAAAARSAPACAGT